MAEPEMLQLSNGPAAQRRYLLALDSYHVVNLHECLTRIARNDQSPAGELDTGDWCRELLYALEDHTRWLAEQGVKPNTT